MSFDEMDDMPVAPPDASDAEQVAKHLADELGEAGRMMSEMMDENPYFREMVSMCHTSEGGAAMWETLFTEAMDPDEDLVAVEHLLDRLAAEARRVIKKAGHLTARRARKLVRRVARDERPGTEG